MDHQRRDIFYIAGAEMGNAVHQPYEKKEIEKVFAILKCCKETRKFILTHEAAAFDGSF